MRRYDLARKLLKLPAPQRPQQWPSADSYPYPDNCNADEGLGPAGADSLELHSVPCVWALCRRSLSSLLNKRNKQRKFKSQGGFFPALPYKLGFFLILPTDSMDEHPTHAELAGNAKYLEATIVQSLVQNSNCGWFLVLGSFRAREDSNWKPKENRKFKESNLSSPSRASLVSIPCPNQFPGNLSTQHPKSQLDFYSRKEKGGNVQTRWNPQSQCFYCRFHTFGQIDISFQGKSLCQMPRNGNLHFALMNVCFG